MAQSKETKKKEHDLTLFGSEKYVQYACMLALFINTTRKPWVSDDWTASDDRVRGGKSQVSRYCGVIDRD